MSTSYRGPATVRVGNLVFEGRASLVTREDDHGLPTWDGHIAIDDVRARDAFGDGVLVLPSGSAGSVHIASSERRAVHSVLYLQGYGPAPYAEEP